MVCGAFYGGFWRKLQIFLKKIPKKTKTTKDEILISRIMKQVLIIIAAALSALAMSSCSSVADIDIDNASSKAVSVFVDVKSSLLGTRSNNDPIKSEWNSQDCITVSSNGHSYTFKANECGPDASFTVSGSSSSWSDGAAFAFFPKSILLDNNTAHFSYAGQSGLFEDLEQFDVMASASTVSNGSVTFSFNQQSSVIAISKKMLYEGSNFSSIVISGDTVSSEIVINNPAVKDNMVYVAFFVKSGKVNVDVYATDGAHFFTTPDASMLIPGSVTSMENAEWDRGIEVSFDASANWN